jgi:hypothetical protein
MGDEENLKERQTTDAIALAPVEIVGSPLSGSLHANCIARRQIASSIECLFDSFVDVVFLITGSLRADCFCSFDDAARLSESAMQYLRTLRLGSVCALAGTLAWGAACPLQTRQRREARRLSGPQMLELIPHWNSFIREAACSRVAEILEA